MPSVRITVGDSLRRVFAAEPVFHLLDETFLLAKVPGCTARRSVTEHTLEGCGLADLTHQVSAQRLESTERPAQSTSKESTVNPPKPSHSPR